MKCLVDVVMRVARRTWTASSSRRAIPARGAAERPGRGLLVPARACATVEMRAVALPPSPVPAGPGSLQAGPGPVTV